MDTSIVLRTGHQIFYQDGTCLVPGFRDSYTCDTIYNNEFNIDSMYSIYSRKLSNAIKREEAEIENDYSHGIGVYNVYGDSLLIRFFDKYAEYPTSFTLNELNGVIINDSTFVITERLDHRNPGISIKRNDTCRFVKADNMPSRLNWLFDTYEKKDK